MLTVLQLFWSFTIIGFTSFGGMSMIPLITDEMLTHGWMTAAEVSDIVAIAEMTPGPLGLNCATFAGIRTAGLAGAIAANLGVLAPTFTLTLVVALFFEKFKESDIMRKILVGVRPACIGLVAALIISLSMTNYTVESAISPVAIGIGVLDMVLLVKFKWSIPKVIVVSAVIGLVCFGLLGL